MKLLFQRILPVLVVLFIPFSAVNAQAPDIFTQLNRFEGFNFGFTGNGARARGMGNAFLGVSDDVTAIGWNPAGMFKVESLVMGISYGSLKPRGVSSSNRTDLSGILPSFERTSRDHTGSFGALSSVNLVSPLRFKGHPFVGTLSYTRVSDEYQFSVLDFDLLEVFPIFNEVGVLIAQDTVVATVDVLTELEGGIDAINFGFGTRLSGNLAFGTSVNIYSGAVRRQTEGLVLGDNVPVNNFQNGKLTQNTLSADSSSFGGFNFTIGLKHDGEKLDLGLVVKTPFSLSQKSLNFSTVITKINGVVSNTDTTITIDLLTKYELPLMVGFGIGYNVSENWLLALDLDYRNFSSKRIKIRQSVTLIPGANNIEEFQVLSEQQWQWSNVFIVRAGTEFLKETGVGIIPIRAGFGYVPVPTPDTDVNGNRSTAVGYEFSLGSGIHWSQIKLDVAYNYTTLNLNFQSSAANIDNKNHFITASFTGFF